jgi:FlaA1/EpsC-like NDP-sugar epimerase
LLVKSSLGKKFTQNNLYGVPMTNNPWKDKRILITGICGTVGRELLRQLLTYGPKEIIGLDNNETELFFLDQVYQDFNHVHVYLGDVRDRDKLTFMMRGVDIVLHAAALKHVILCEKAPNDAVQTNIQGVQNVIHAAVTNQVARVLFTSSDKAVNPTNVMGTSKLMGERLMTAANAFGRSNGPIFASTRFGNVLGSRGSVIPVFKKQILSGGPVTLTDPRMTRFIMTLREAVRLVIDSTFLAKGGEVFITKMPIIHIADLAAVMVAILAPQAGFDPREIVVKEIGSKPGEKLYEELMSLEETRRTFELPEYFAVLPAFKSVYQDIDYHYADMVTDKVDHPYNSAVEPAMTAVDLERYVIKHKLLEDQ